MTDTTLILFNKPFGVHSQFRKDNAAMRTLADFFADKSLRVVGRLDADSEGLLLLTDNGRLNHAIASPDNTRQKHGKIYLVQVENTPTEVQLQALRAGVILKDGKTLPADVRCVAEDDLPIELWQRDPPIRERKSIPTAWLIITIFEGKNRQVRRMTAHVGLPCLRLIRYRVADFDVANLAVGEYHRLSLTAKELAKYGVYTQNPSQADKTNNAAQSKRTAGKAFARQFTQSSGKKPPNKKPLNKKTKPSP